MTRTLGVARLMLFDETRQLRTGLSKVLVQLDASTTAASQMTAGDEHKIARLEQLSVRHEAAAAQPDAVLDWLNRPTYAHLEQRQQVRGRLCSLTLCVSISQQLVRGNGILSLS